MNRRDILGALVAMAAEPGAHAQPAANHVQLFLQRESPEPRVCGNVRLIKGNLYGVPGNIRLEDVATSLGLEHISRTEELPYEGNVRDISSIPADTYEATVRSDKTKKWMINANRSWRLELSGTPGRSAIQFHYGTDYSWSRGCVILTGNHVGDLMCVEGSNSPEEAVAALRRYVETGHDSSTIIKIRIAFA